MLKQMHSSSKNLENRIIYLLTSLTAIFIFFQINLVVGSFQLNINIADIFAICSLFAFVHHTINLKKIDFFIPNTNQFLMLLVALFAVSLINGILSFGFTVYAINSKFIGIFILIGYFSLGALYSRMSNATDIKNINKILLTSLITIISIKIIINLIFLSKIFNLDSLGLDLRGYANNRNAFAIQILSLACLQIFNDNKHRTLILSILLTGVLLTCSRAGILASVIMLSFWAITRTLCLKEFAKLAIYISILYSLVLFTENNFNHFTYLAKSNLDNSASITPYIPSVNTDSMHTFSGFSSDLERFYSIKQALLMWVKRPFLGIGLGGFINDQLKTQNQLLVIHNTFIWLLTEFGLIGITFFAWYAKNIILYLSSKIKHNTPEVLRRKVAFASLCIIFGVTSMAHEVFYQRILWFITGILITTPINKSRSHNTEDITHKI